MVHCPWISLRLPLMSVSCLFFYLYCAGLNNILLLFFYAARRALVYTRGSRLISISLLLSLLSLLLLLLLLLLLTKITGDGGGFLTVAMF